MESVLLAVALLGFGIGGYFVVGRVARFFAIGTSGRSAGQQLVTVGQTYLTDGTPVRIVSGEE